MSSSGSGGPGLRERVAGSALGVTGAVVSVTGLIRIDAGAVVIGLWYLGSGLGVMGLALRPDRLFMRFGDYLDDTSPRTSLESGLESVGEVCVWFACGCGLLGLILEFGGG